MRALTDTDAGINKKDPTALQSAAREGREDITPASPTTFGVNY